MILISHGLDPAFGFLHADRSVRLSLSYDCLELLRPKVTNVVMHWAMSQTFTKADFAVFEGGVVRLSAPIARDVAAQILASIPIKEYGAAVREVIRLL